jgi:hypothetical protein
VSAEIDGCFGIRCCTAVVDSGYSVELAVSSQQRLHSSGENSFKRLSVLAAAPTYHHKQGGEHDSTIGCMAWQLHWQQPMLPHAKQLAC